MEKQENQKTPIRQMWQWLEEQWIFAATEDEIKIVKNKPLTDFIIKAKNKAAEIEAEFNERMLKEFRQQPLQVGHKPTVEKPIRQLIEHIKAEYAELCRSEPLRLTKGMMRFYTSIMAKAQDIANGKPVPGRIEPERTPIVDVEAKPDMVGAYIEPDRGIPDRYSNPWNASREVNWLSNNGIDTYAPGTTYVPPEPHRYDGRMNNRFIMDEAGKKPSPSITHQLEQQRILLSIDCTLKDILKQLKMK